MLEVHPSTVDLDLESILWFWVKIRSSIDPPEVKLNPELILRFQVEMSRKISWPWPQSIL